MADGFENSRYTLLTGRDGPPDSARDLRDAAGQIVTDYPDLSGPILYASGPPETLRDGVARFGAHGLDPHYLRVDELQRF